VHPALQSPHETARLSCSITCSILPADPDLGWLPWGQQQLLLARHWLLAEDELLSVDLLRAVARREPCRRPLCDALAGRGLAAMLQRTPTIALEVGSCSQAPPEAVLQQVLEHPATHLRLRTAELPALQLAALYQLVWDAWVSLELDLAGHHGCADEGVDTVDQRILLGHGGEAQPLNGRDPTGPGGRERAVRLTLVAR
jgi:hypothetical protein